MAKLKIDTGHPDEPDDATVMITRGLLDQLWRLASNGHARLPDIEPGRAVEGIWCMPDGTLGVQYADGGTQVSEEWPEVIDG